MGARRCDRRRLGSRPPRLPQLSGGHVGPRDRRGAHAPRRQGVAPLSATGVHAEEWTAKDVSIGDVVSALYRLRSESAVETEGPDLRTSVMTHLAWVPHEWQEAAVETLAGLGDRHPSRGVLLFPEASATD